VKIDRHAASTGYRAKNFYAADLTRLVDSRAAELASSAGPSIWPACEPHLKRIEDLFLQPSNPIQCADLAPGAIWRKFERGDATWLDLLLPSIRKRAAGST
jgi:hypothetical protein